MNKYIKKPIPIEAEQFLLVMQECEPEQCFLGYTILKDDKGFYLTIPTPEGNHRADLGDWIVKGYSSKLGIHYWPVKPDYFSENYVPFGTSQPSKLVELDEESFRPYLITALSDYATSLQTRIFEADRSDIMLNHLHIICAKFGTHKVSESKGITEEEIRDIVSGNSTLYHDMKGKIRFDMSERDLLNIRDEILDSLPSSLEVKYPSVEDIEDWLHEVYFDGMTRTMSPYDAGMIKRYAYACLSKMKELNERKVVI